MNWSRWKQLLRQNIVTAYERARVWRKQQSGKYFNGILWQAGYSDLGIYFAFYLLLPENKGDMAKSLQGRNRGLLSQDPSFSSEVVLFVVFLNISFLGES